MIYKQERLELRLSEREREILDRVRGSATRSAWLRNQIHLADKEEVVVALPRNEAGDALNAVTGYPGEPAMVDQALLPSQKAPRMAVESRVEPAVDSVPDNPVASTDEFVEQHYHRRGERLDPPRWEKGKAVYTYRCAIPGCAYTME